MKKIIVPTDFSAYANKALAYAVELARKLHARVALVHACDLLDEEFSGHKALIQDYNRERVEELKGKLEGMKELIQKSEGFTVDTRLYEGPIVTSILQAAGDYGADAEFRARFKRWLGEVWSEKDRRLEAMSVAG